jgi:uncharacterized membrane protein
MGPHGRLQSPPPHPLQFQNFGHGGHHPLAWIFVLVVILLVVIVVYYAIRYANRPFDPTAGVAAMGVAASPGRDILGVVALRYANGEIGRDEFLRMSADLGGPPVPGSTPDS